MEPVDEADLDKWYREEHLDMLSKVPEYRRSLRCVLGPKTGYTEAETPRYLAIHEFDGSGGVGGKEAEAANTTPWTVKHITGAKRMTVRCWKLIYSQGF
jgi:hypothetical protein